MSERDDRRRMNDSEAAWAEAERRAAIEADRPIFEALLVPYRSLGRKGFAVLMVFFGGISLVTGVAFLAKGAWPVVGFLGLDVLLVWLAFMASYRSGRAREEVRLSRSALSVRKISPAGRMREAHHNPMWSRFNVARKEEIGVVGMAVESRGARTEIGEFLNPEDRESFAKAFAQALSTAKRG